MNLQEYQRTFKRVCFDLEVSDADLLSLGGDPAGWRDYREIVRRRLRGMSQHAFGRTQRLVGEPAFLACFDRSLVQSPPASAFIREVIAGFGRFAAEDPELLQAASSAQDMLRFEAAKWELGDLDVAQPAVGQGGVREFDFEGVPVLNPALRILAVQHPVHLEDEEQARVAKPLHLLVYRPRGIDGIRWWADDIFAATLIGGLAAATQSVTECVHGAAAAADLAVDEDLLARLARLLAMAVERGVLVGSRDA